MDTLTPAQRSARMALVKSRDTKPEMLVRRLVHGLGYRYRLHAPDLPGRPDLVFRSRWKVVFVHGCFWHAHQCRRGRPPTSNVEFWTAKRDANVARDKRVRRALRSLGWRSLIVWECEIADSERLSAKIIPFLDAP